MLDATQAKKLFRNTLTLLLVTVFWPAIGVLIISITALISTKAVNIVSIILAAAWLALFIWLIVKFWKIGPQVEITSWGALWLLLPVFGIFIVSMLYLEPLKYITDRSNLPLTWKLIKDTWSEFVKHVKPALNSAMWLLYGSLILGAVLFLTAIWPIFYYLYVIAGIGFVFLALWVTMKIFLVMYNLDTDGKIKGDEGRISIKKFWSMLWIAILTLLIVVGPVLLAYALYFLGLLGWGKGLAAVIESFESNSQNIFPLLANVGLGIAFLIALVAMIFAGFIWIAYKSTQYKLALPALLFQDKKGMEALHESARIIKNRWWGFFWKNLLIGMTAGALLGIVLQVAIGIILAAIFAVLPKGAVGNGLNGFLTLAGQGAMQIILVPFLLLFGAKLYKAFVKTAR